MTSKDVNAIWLKAVQNTVWKAIDSTSADIIFQNWPCVRIGQDVLYCGIDLQGKIPGWPLENPPLVATIDSPSTNFIFVS
jgi:hypothetical protein